ncbi:MAG: TonB-dependent receptor [Melioribacteraceae bacterium]|nr:MAG: TonB-dependent receptor [Melioribacteraceae bacterium]
MKNIIILILLLSTLFYAQTGGVKGVVSENGTPLPGVNILIKDTNIGTVTNSEGDYSIRNIQPGELTLRFSIVGYKTRFIDLEIQPNRIIEVNVNMEVSLIEVDEVKVVDQSRQQANDTRTSLLDVEPDKARVLPGAVTDVFRTLQAMPGVLAPNDFSSQLIVRGSGPDQNLIIMDDVEIFNPYRLYGVISMFNPEAVTDINLITGGFPSMYGDRLSAVLDVTNKQGSRTETLKGNLNASIVAANLVLEGKNPFNIPGSWLVNSRRTYYDLVVEPFVKNAGLVEENVSFPNFYDIQTKLAFGPFDGHKFLINGIYSRDAVNVVSGENRRTPDSVSVQDLSKNDLASLAWHYAPNERFLNKVVVSWYKNSGDANFDSDFLDPSLNREDFEEVETDTLAPYLLNFKFDTEFSFRKYSFDDKLSWFWGDGNEFNAGIGFDMMQTVFDFDFTFDPALEAFIRSNPNSRSAIDDIRDVRDYKRYRAYLHNNFKISDKFFFQPGLRVDHYDILEKTYVAPRISAAYSFDNITTLRAVWGQYYQSPGYEKLRDAQILFDLQQSVTRNLEAEKATHYVLGIERWVTQEWRAKVEGYYKKFENLIIADVLRGSTYYTEPIPGKDPRFSSGWTRPVVNVGDSTTQIPINGGNGEAYGVEFMLEKKNVAGFDQINGWISYSLAWAERNERGLKIPFRFDQRHTMNLVMNYKFSDSFDMGISFQYGSGFPLTEAVGVRPRILLEDNDGDFIPESPVIATREIPGVAQENQEVIYDVDFGSNANKLNSRRPVYHRLDVRFNYYTKLWGQNWTFYIDVVNVYNRENVINYDYYVTEDLTLGREKTTMFPILPTFGFNVSF